MALLLLVSLFLSCVKDPPVDTSNPTDLVLAIQVANDGSGKVDIQATATNAVEFQLLVGAEPVLVDSNTAGTFQHIFTRQGSFILEVRAVGESGRYIKEVREIEIDLGSTVTLGQGFTSPLSYAGYNLIWNDEFEGEAVNSGNWIFEIGTGCPNNCGWGNNELEYYRRENAKVSDGVLQIEAKEQAFQGRKYTSARLITKNLQSFQYGRIDIRALLPKGQGMWPALWMLGNNISSVGWPACGEIDIMEMVGGNGREKTSHGTIHWQHAGEHAQAGGSHTLSTGTLADEYHVFTILWDESSIKWLVNDREFYTVSISPSELSEFHQKFFFVINLAVGGNWPGSPDSSTAFPQSMKVDYIRVFQKQN